MNIILLERVAKLGQMGEVVRVKNGYARNFLLPRGKALRATEANKKHFEGQRAQLETRNLERKGEAEAIGEKLNGQVFTIIRQAGDFGQLYGSVSTRDIAEAATAGGFSVERNQVILHTTRSRRSACTRRRCICIRKWMSKSSSTSPVRLRKPSVRPRANWRLSARKPTWPTSAWKSARPWPKPVM